MESSTLSKCKDYEHQILELAGMARSDYSLKDCSLGAGRHIHYVQVHKTPPTESNVLLVTHGYFASCMAFFKMYPLLQNDFHIVSFDTVGHGLSSYDKTTPDSIDGWIDYFLGDIKAFVDKLGLKRFHVMGHSMGGFIMGHFASRYPEHVRQLFLLSPGGVNRTNPEYSQMIDGQAKKANCFVRKLIQSVGDKIFVDKQSPMDHWAAKTFRCALVKGFYGERLSLSKQEQKLFGKLYLKISKNKPSSEKCLGYLFNMGPMSERPLLPIFEQLHGKMRICIMFGSTDWMDFQLTTERIRQKQLDISIETISNSGHQLPFENPLEVSRNVLFHVQREKHGSAVKTPVLK